LIAAGLLLGTGCVERKVVYVREPASPPPAGETVVVEEPPPPYEEVVTVSPGPEYVWMPGVWEGHGRWVWVGGRYVVRPHPGAMWVGGHWAHRGRGYVWVRGYWR